MYSNLMVTNHMLQCFCYPH